MKFNFLPWGEGEIHSRQSAFRIELLKKKKEEEKKRKERKKRKKLTDGETEVKIHAF